MTVFWHPHPGNSNVLLADIALASQFSSLKGFIQNCLIVFLINFELCPQKSVLLIFKEKTFNAKIYPVLPNNPLPLNNKKCPPTQTTQNPSAVVPSPSTSSTTSSPSPLKVKKTFFYVTLSFANSGVRLKCFIVARCGSFSLNSF